MHEAGPELSPLPTGVSDNSISLFVQRRKWFAGFADHIPRNVGGMIRDSFQIAKERGLDFSFIANEEETDIHPNTVDIRMTGQDERVMTVRGESLGGGKVRIVRINQVKVEFTGEYSAVIVIHQDRPGVAAHITKCLSDRNVNIAFMRLFRESKGHTAYTIVESDGRLPEDVTEMLKENCHVRDVMIVQS